MKLSLEDRLVALRGPAMPADVESRIRKRIMEEAARRPAATRLPGDRSVAQPMRFFARPSHCQLALLLVLAAAACWVLRSAVAPVFRAAWERSHCLVVPAAKPR